SSKHICPLTTWPQPITSNTAIPKKQLAYSVRELKLRNNRATAKPWASFAPVLTNCCSNELVVGGAVVNPARNKVNLLLRNRTFKRHTFVLGILLHFLRIKFCLIVMAKVRTNKSVMASRKCTACFHDR